MSATHEDFGREVRRKGPSDRNFGIVFTLAFLFLGLWPLYRGRPVRLWCLAIAAPILLVTVLQPALLHAPNALWTKLGRALGRVVNPIVTGLLFYVVFTPAAALLRRLGRDLLHLNFDCEAQSYWILRSEEASDMSNQF